MTRHVASATRLLAVMAPLAGAAGLLAPAAADAPKPPPLKKDEQVYKIKGGCGIISAKTTGEAAAAAAKMVAGYTWSGACVGGLLMGEGVLTVPKVPALSFTTQPQWFWWGRNFGEVRETYDSGIVSVSFRWEDRKTMMFPADGSLTFNRRPFSSMANDGRQIVNATDQACVHFKPERMPAICKGDNDSPNFDLKIYGAAVYENGDFRNSTIAMCPKATSPAGCEAVWQQAAAPIIANIKAFMAEVAPKVEARKAEARKLIEAQKAEKQRVAAEKAAAAAEAKRVAEEQAAAAAKQGEELAAIKTATDAAIAAEQSKADAAFTASLEKLDAGKLFVLADEMKRKGEIDKARLVLTALLSRHADHAMAAPAAQALTALDTAPVKAPAKGTEGKPAEESACVRNGKRLDAFVAELKKTTQYPAADASLVAIRTHDERMKLYVPCSAADPAARTELERSVGLKKRAEEKCAAAGAEACKAELTGGAKAWVDAIRAEVQKALADSGSASAGGAGVPAAASGTTAAN